MFYPRNILYHTASWFEAVFHVDPLVPHDCARRSGGGGESGGVEWPHVAEDTPGIGFSAVWWWKSFPLDIIVVILVRTFSRVFQPSRSISGRSWVGALSGVDFFVSFQLYLTFDRVTVVPVNRLRHDFDAVRSGRKNQSVVCPPKDVAAVRCIEVTLCNTLCNACARCRLPFQSQAFCTSHTARC